MTLSIIKFEEERGVEQYDSLDQLGDVGPGEAVWIDIESDDIAELSQVGSFFGFHELTIEDCLTAGDFPKLDDYGSYLFLIFRGLKSWGEVEEIWESEDDDPAVAQEGYHLFTKKLSIYLSQNFDNLPVPELRCYPPPTGTSLARRGFPAGPAVSRAAAGRRHRRDSSPGHRCAD